MLLAAMAETPENGAFAAKMRQVEHRVLKKVMAEVCIMFVLSITIVAIMPQARK
ncbi:hypothetical protein [Sphingobium aquiterrae]|uniref:hypothetical protein n=1 Tax=Sphingobium aquiterrae TaxID=2038656 RepID=UPI003019C077